MKTYQNITIKIGDVAPISMSIAPDSEEWIREAERSVNRVWSRWRAEFENKSSKEVLAMAAFQFAKLYFQLKHNVDSNQKILSDFEHELDRLLEIADSAVGKGKSDVNPGDAIFDSVETATTVKSAHI